MVSRMFCKTYKNILGSGKKFYRRNFPTSELSVGNYRGGDDVFRGSHKLHVKIYAHCSVIQYPICSDYCAHQDEYLSVSNNGHRTVAASMQYSKCWPFVNEHSGSIGLVHHKLSVSDFKCED